MSIIAELVKYTVGHSIKDGEEKFYTVPDHATHKAVCDYIRAHYTVRAGILTPGRWRMTGSTADGAVFHLRVEVRSSRRCCERDTDGDGNCDRHPANRRRA